MIRILVDADACPVKDEIYKVAWRHEVRVIIVSNSPIRIPAHPLIERIVVSDGFDAADDWIAEQTDEDAIAITADILLADRCLKAGAGAVLNRVEIAENQISIELDRAGVQQLLGTELQDNDHALRLTSRTTRIRQGKDVRIIVCDEADRSNGTVNQPLVALIAEAHDLHRRLLADPAHSIRSLADALGKCRKRAARLMRIALLAPDIIESCLAGTQPVSLTTKQLLNVDLPVGWQAQRSLLGFT